PLKQRKGKAQNFPSFPLVMLWTLHYAKQWLTCRIHPRSDRRRSRAVYKMSIVWAPHVAPERDTDLYELWRSSSATRTHGGRGAAGPDALCASAGAGGLFFA